jgi:hypothetical protein
MRDVDRLVRACCAAHATAEVGVDWRIELVDEARGDAGFAGPDGVHAVCPRIEVTAGSGEHLVGRVRRRSKPSRCVGYALVGQCQRRVFRTL